MSDRVKFAGAVTAAFVALLAMVLTGVHAATGSHLKGHDAATCPICVAAREAGPSISPSPPALILDATPAIDALVLPRSERPRSPVAIAGPRSVRGPPAAV